MGILYWEAWWVSEEEEEEKDKEEEEKEEDEEKEATMGTLIHELPVVKGCIYSI